jgi:hypothetical protein
MTPKEKAEELVKRMYAIHSNSASDITWYFAKQCALLAVDEILNVSISYAGKDYDYWQEVKEEIEKL